MNMNPRKITLIILSVIATAISGLVVFAMLGSLQVKNVSFKEVWTVVTVNPRFIEEDSRMSRDIEKYGTVEEPLLPHYSGNISALISIIDQDMLAAARRTINDKDRAFGFAGKIFPTLNSDEKVKTANFIYC